MLTESRIIHYRVVRLSFFVISVSLTMDDGKNPGGIAIFVVQETDIGIKLIYDERRTYFQFGRRTCQN